MEEKEYFMGSIPVLILYKELEKAKNKGTVIFFHGLGGAKENNIDILRLIAEDGFVAVGVDNYGHGKRRLGNFEEIFSESNPDVERDFLDAVIKTANEVPELLNELVQNDFIKPDNIGLAGVSMGGFITYTAITIEPRIKAAATIVASPQYKIDMDESPHKKIEKFNPIKLLSQNAANDKIVSPVYAREFHDRLKTEYTDYELRFRYIEYPKSDHMMEQDEWELALTNLREWFKKHL